MFLESLKILTAVLALAPTMTLHQGNSVNDSFNKSKAALEEQVYFDHRETLYCGAQFDAHKNVTLPAGFKTDKYPKRAMKVEWEHVVAAENFGRSFKEWREGHPSCVNSKGKPFKGRRCAELANKEYRLMQADMYNLYPAIGSVNAARQNYNFQMLTHAQSDFGSCQVKIEGRRVEPPERARGQIARSYFYMAYSYRPFFKMSRQQYHLMKAWDKIYPVDAWECKRAKRIESIQKNENVFVKQPCIAAGLWH